MTINELGQAFSINEAIALGVFEHLYLDGVFDDQLSTHYIVLDYELNINYALELLPLEQHRKYQ